jgi:hypothetical protein
MATSACTEQEERAAALSMFLRKIELLVLGGFKGSLTLRCQGNRTIRTLEVVEHLTVADLEAQPHEPL